MLVEFVVVPVEYNAYLLVVCEVNNTSILGVSLTKTGSFQFKLNET
jgi:hypothetical protein